MTCYGQVGYQTAPSKKLELYGILTFVGSTRVPGNRSETWQLYSYVKWDKEKELLNKFLWRVFSVLHAKPTCSPKRPSKSSTVLSVHRIRLSYVLGSTRSSSPCLGCLKSASVLRKSVDVAVGLIMYDEKSEEVVRTDSMILPLPDTSKTSRSSLASLLATQV
jgi:hypothetical protein